MASLPHSGTLKSQGSAPGEVSAPPADAAAYEEWRQADTIRAPYKLPGSVLQGIRTDIVEAHVECPLIVFVNARSGGRAGVSLALQLARAIGRGQVFDIGDKEHRPDRVLGKLYDNLRAREAAGDMRAAAVRARLRLLVCGGDGTIAWVMGVVKKLRLQPEPPIAIMPMGTGNDLSRSFLWGPAFTNKWVSDHAAMYKTLNKVALAREARLDCWNLTLTTPRKALLGNGYPHSLSPPQPPAAAAAAAAAGGGGGGGRASGVVPAGPMARTQGSGLFGPGAAGASPAPAVHPAVAAAQRDASMAGVASERSVAVSMAVTVGSATPLHNIATSSVGSAVTTFTTATNMSMAGGGAAPPGTSVPPTIVSGAVSNSAEEESGIGVLSGTFWNYFSIGLDAKAAWQFHSLREERPGCTASRAANQFWYSAFSCATGWFCCAQPLNVKVTLEVLRPGPGGDSAGWQPVKLPVNVKALVVLNLQSYAGGRNLWGPKTSKHAQRKHGLKPPAYDDGMLEVVGLQSGWHTGIVMASKGSILHASRICQAAGVRLALHAPYVRGDGEPSHVYMQLDGEPWKQDIPVKGVETPVRVEIVHAGQSRLLRNEHVAPRASLSTLSQKASPASAVSPRAFAPVVSATPEAGPSSPQVPAVVGAAAAAAAPASVHGPPQPRPPSVSGSLPSMAAGGGAGSGAPGGSAMSVQQVAPNAAAGAGAGAGAPSSAAWTRLGSGGRPSRAGSAAGSSAVGGPDGGAAAGGDGASVGGAAARGNGAAGAASGGKPADGTASGAANSHADGVASPTPRTLSGETGSQGGRSAAQE